MAPHDRPRDAQGMTSLTQAATFVDAETVPVLDHLDLLCRVLLDGSATDGRLALVEERGALGCMTPRHVHEREAETFVVLDGALEGWCDGSRRLVEAGGVLHLPAGLEHAFRVASRTAHFYVLVSPAGFESFFTATGRVVETSFDGDLPVPGAPTPEAVAALQAVLGPLGCSITGPPPFDQP